MVKALALAMWILAWSISGSAASPVTETSASRLDFTINGNVLRIPYYRNLAVSYAYPHVVRAAVLVHGTSRNAVTAYDNLVQAAAITGIADSTAIYLAPHFLIEEDIAALGLASDVLFWSESGWKEGDRSLDTVAYPRPATISSFAIMDSILYRLASLDPNLQSIVVGGHSAGGQFVQRYAAGNRIEPVLLDQFGVHVSYIVANPSSYMYLNEERAVAGTLDTFAVPPPETLLACPDFNRYKYGLAQRNSYMAAVSDQQIISQYSTRYVTYMLGTLDTDPNDPELDTTCPANLQGAYRLARGWSYVQYLKHFYGPWVESTHRVVLVPGVGHSSSGIFDSTCGAWLLFRGSYCSILAGLGHEDPDALAASLDFPNPFRSPMSIQYRVPEGGERVTMRLYDIRGRVVRTLVDGVRPAGLATVLWDGRSERGDRLPAGIYVCRLQEGRQSISSKITLLR